MEIFNILNEFEEIVEDSPKVPVVGKLLLNEDVVLDFIDRIRTALPEEIRQARRMVAERERILTDAQEQVAKLLNESKEELEKKFDESEVLKEAQARAEEIIAQANEKAQEIRAGALSYTDGLLGNIEKLLQKSLSEVSAGRDQVGKPGKKSKS